MIDLKFEIEDIDFGQIEIEENIQDVISKESKTGFFQEDVEDGIALAELMAVHEYGSPERKIPERPAMRTTADTKQQEISKNMFKIADQMIFKNMSTDIGYQIIGDLYKKQFQDGIITRSLGLKANADITAKRKGSDTPLIDTGRLVGGIRTKVGDA